MHEHAQWSTHAEAMPAKPATNKTGGKVSYRRGKWTSEEEAFANRLIHEFKMGMLPLTDGTTLRTFLSKLLNCDPMRISKKFVGQNCIGKQVFRRKQQELDKMTPEQLERTRAELSELERLFLERVAQTNHSQRASSNAVKSGRPPYLMGEGAPPWMLPPEEPSDHVMQLDGGRFAGLMDEPKRAPPSFSSSHNTSSRAVDGALDRIPTTMMTSSSLSSSAVGAGGGRGEPIVLEGNHSAMNNNAFATRIAQQQHLTQQQAQQQAQHQQHRQDVATRNSNTGQGLRRSNSLELLDVYSSGVLAQSSPETNEANISKVSSFDILTTLLKE